MGTIWRERDVLSPDRQARPTGRTPIPPRISALDSPFWNLFAPLCRPATGAFCHSSAIFRRRADRPGRRPQVAPATPAPQGPTRPPRSVSPPSVPAMAPFRRRSARPGFAGDADAPHPIRPLTGPKNTRFERHRLDRDPRIGRAERPSEAECERHRCKCLTCRDPSCLPGVRAPAHALFRIVSKGGISTMFDLKRVATAAVLVFSVGTATATAQAATIDADIMFVVDGSGSMGDDFTELGLGMTTFVNALQADSRMGSVRVGLVRYSLNQLLQINLTDDLTRLRRAEPRQGQLLDREPAPGHRLRRHEQRDQLPARCGQDGRPHHRRGRRRLEHLFERLRVRRLGPRRASQRPRLPQQRDPQSRQARLDRELQPDRASLRRALRHHGIPHQPDELPHLLRQREGGGVRGRARAASAVRRPAARWGWLLLGGLGALAAVRRRKA
jgi:hypothetical protein